MPDTKTVVGVFQDEHKAEQAVQHLRDNGFPDNEISIVGRDNRKKNNGDQTQNAGGMMHHDVSSGATWGAGIGGAAGLLASAGALAIPGIGPLVAMGPLAATLGLAAGGGLAGALVDFGIPEKQSHEYEHQVKQGRCLVVLKTSGDAQKAERMLRQEGASDLNID